MGRFWSLFLVLFCFMFFFDKGELIVFITTDTNSKQLKNVCGRASYTNFVPHAAKLFGMKWGL